MIFDFRLQVFHVVARRLSFTRAAEELYVTQPAVTKHIRALEQQFRAKLFERRGNSILLTEAGNILLRYTTALERLYNELEQEMNALAGAEKGLLRLGASTTIAQYILPPLLAAFRARYADIELQVVSGNTETVEGLLLAAGIDLGFIEGPARNRQIRYELFRQDELVLAARPDHPFAAKKGLKVSDLPRLPLVMREPGSGTLEVVMQALKGAGLKWQQLDIVLQLDSTEAIKSYLLHGDCAAFVSRSAVQQELEHGILRELKIQGFHIVRPLSLICLQGEPSRLAGIFRKFVLHHNRK